MRYGGIYLYILCSFKKDVVMSPTNPNLVLRRRITAQGVLFLKFGLYSCFTSSTSYHLYP